MPVPEVRKTVVVVVILNRPRRRIVGLGRGHGGPERREPVVPERRRRGRAPRVELEREGPVLAGRDQRQRAAVERATHGRPPAAAHVAAGLDVRVVGEARGARGVAVAVACVEIKIWAPHAIDATLSR